MDIPPNMHYKFVTASGEIYFLGECGTKKARQFGKSKKAIIAFVVKAGKLVPFKLSG